MQLQLALQTASLLSCTMVYVHYGLQTASITFEHYSLRKTSESNDAVCKANRVNGDSFCVQNFVLGLRRKEGENHLRKS